MKKTISFILAIMLCMSLCACSITNPFAPDPTPTPTAEPTKEPTSTPGPTPVPDPLLGTSLMENLSEDGKVVLALIEEIEMAYNSYRMAKLGGGDLTEFITQGADAFSKYHQQLGILSIDEQRVLSNYLETIAFENNMDLSIFEIIEVPNTEE